MQKGCHTSQAETPRSALPPNSATVSTLCKKSQETFAYLTSLSIVERIRISKYTSSELTQEKLQTCQLWVNFALLKEFHS